MNQIYKLLYKIAINNTHYLYIEYCPRTSKSGDIDMRQLRGNQESEWLSYFILQDTGATLESHKKIAKNCKRT